MNKIKELIVKYREIITYIIAGGLTTLVNLITFQVFNNLLGQEKYLISNIIAWIVGVIFAYIINKLWVFESKSWQANVILKEIPEFVGARLFSLFIEEFGLWLFVDKLRFDRFSFDLFGFNINGKLISKLVLAVIVVILNYVFSKLVIFKTKKQ